MENIELQQGRMILLAQRAAIDAMAREREQARAALESRLQAALCAVAGVIVPRAEHDVLQAAADLLGHEDLRPERALVLVEPRRRQLENALGDVDAGALEIEAATLDGRRRALLELAVAGTERVRNVEHDARFPALQAAANGTASAADVSAAKGLLIDCARSWSVTTASELLAALADEKRRLLDVVGEARLLSSTIARLQATARRRRDAEAGLRALDDDVLARVRSTIGQSLAARLRERATLADFDVVAARVAQREPSSRRVLRAARVVAASLRYLDAAWECFVEPLARRVSAALLQLDVALQEPDVTFVDVGTLVGDDLGAAVQEGGRRFAAVVAAALGFHDYDKVHDDDILWDRIFGGEATRVALGPLADGGFIDEVREARARVDLHTPTIVTGHAAAPGDVDVESEKTAASWPSAPPERRSRASVVEAGADPHARPVARLGRYRLEQRLGQGGMAEVFLATQDGPRGFTRKVVVKRILAEHQDDPHFIAMFQREAALIARLQHPHIVDVYELGVEGDVWFMAMELLEGLPLHEMLRRTSVDIPVLARIICDAAAGLAFAHARGVIHRDISPDNIFVTRAGRTKVIDFGIARGADDASHTQVGVLKGKIPFMAPELLKGEAFDGAVDVFALGVSLWSSLVGRRPWEGETLPAIIRSILERPADPPSRHRDGIPVLVDELVTAMLAQQASRRPSANDVMVRLSTIAVEHSAIAMLPVLQSP